MAPGAIRNTRCASGRTCNRGRGGGAEVNHPTPSVSSGRDDSDAINDSSSSNDSRTCSDNNNSDDSGDLPALVGRSPRGLEIIGEPPALQSGRTRSQSRGLTMNASYADALLAYTINAVEAKRTVEEEAAEIERAHDSLLEERLEEEREWLKKLERRGALLEQHELDQQSRLPPRNGGRTTTRAEYSVTNREETQRSRVAPTQCSRGRTVCLPEGLGTGPAVRVREEHENGNLLDGRQGTGEM